jgi:hypothetical protein
VWCQSGALNFGNTDGSGNPTATRAYVDQSGNFVAINTVIAPNVEGQSAVYPSINNNTGYYLTSDGTYNYVVHQVGGAWQER